MSVPARAGSQIQNAQYENLHARRSALKSRQLKRAIRGRLVGLVRVVFVLSLEIKHSSTLEQTGTSRGPGD